MISVWWCRVLYHKVYIDNTVLYHCMVLWLTIEVTIAGAFSKMM